MKDYIGRFAPSPTGALHLGSLFTAVGSYLDAKHHKGIWLIRLEDIDPPRERAGSAESIIEELSRFGLYSDLPITKQSNHYAQYEQALQNLQQQGCAYPCQCTRKELQKSNSIHLYRQCYSKLTALKEDITSYRLAVENGDITFVDLLAGEYRQDAGKEVGDFILKRKGGLYSYHLAVVIDDHNQQISHIVRGLDLIDSTPRQIYLQQKLGLERIEYLHLPLLSHVDGSKLSKQTFAKSTHELSVSQTLYKILALLGQAPPAALATASEQTILSWGIENWSREKLPKQRAIVIEGQNEGLSSNSTH